MSTSCGTGSGNFPQPGDPDLNNSTINVSPGFGGIEVAWTYPELNSHAVAHTRLYRSTSIDPATMTLYRIVTGNYFFDATNTATTIEYFYWIQIVSVNDTIGDVIGPVAAMARPTITQIMEGLTEQIEAGQLAQSLKAEISKIQTNRLSISQEIMDRAEADDSLAVAFDEVRADTDTAVAQIQEEALLRAEADSAQVNAINTVAVSSDDNQAAIQDEREARLSRDEAFASDISTVQTTLNGDSASGQVGLVTQVETVAGEVSNIGAQYTAQLDVNGVVGGFGVYNDGTTVEAGFRVDRFWVGKSEPAMDGEGNEIPGSISGVHPFMIEGDEVFIKEAVIKSLTVEKLQSAGGDLAFTPPIYDAEGNVEVESKLKVEHLDVNNIHVGGESVFSGKLDVDSGGPTGSLRIVGDRLEVYEGGTLRIRIGRLN